MEINLTGAAAPGPSTHEAVAVAGWPASFTIPQIYSADPRVEFLKALAAFQGEMPAIEKTIEAEVRKEGRLLYTYKYADLAEILRVAKPLLAKHGLGFFQESEVILDGGNSHLVVETTLFHIAGHERKLKPTRFPLEFGPRGDTQHDIGGYVTYFKRIALNAALGISPAFEDDDNQKQVGAGMPAGAPVDEIGDDLMPIENLRALQARILEAGTTDAKLLKTIEGAPRTIDQLSKPQYDEAMNSLAVKISAKAKAV